MRSLVVITIFAYIRTYIWMLFFKAIPCILSWSIYSAIWKYQIFRIPSFFIFGISICPLVHQAYNSLAWVTPKRLEIFSTWQSLAVCCKYAGFLSVSCGGCSSPHLIWTDWTESASHSTRLSPGVNGLSWNDEKLSEMAYDWLLRDCSAASVRRIWDAQKSRL